MSERQRPASAVLTFAREPHRRGLVRVESWWGRALLRAIEERAFDDNQLTGARALARSGRIGGLVVESGRFAAAVEDERGLWTVTGAVPGLDADSAAALSEVLGASPERTEALLVGELPLDVAEHAEEAGVELVPYGDELAVTCTCGHWHAVCGHSLAVLHQLCWIVDRDASVLLQLRGVGRDELLGRLRKRLRQQPEPDRAGSGEPAREQVDDVEIALDAVLRARHMLEE
ncbi:hypothetical protein FB381_0065 [Nocardioides albertanoniae]|uniref:SWIM-type domain-containing protein n=1 Tax=Nocardioides albertanoniae TaxID=1175486 RepID=A0A543A146_9ACTN|nr:hypothetical protein [Nocardioides albertanoniae]TQL66216.1 hypothetical protein FB381_0065 [Nocardioides albertanoniae]